LSFVLFFFFTSFSFPYYRSAGRRRPSCRRRLMMVLSAFLLAEKEKIWRSKQNKLKLNFTFFVCFLWIWWLLYYCNYLDLL
jgi:hypothetical protein